MSDKPVTMHEDDVIARLVIARLRAENADLRHVMRELMKSLMKSLMKQNKPTLDSVTHEARIRQLTDELERLLDVVGDEDRESIKAVLEGR